MAGMKDAALIEWLAEKLGSQVELAKAVGVEPKALSAWKQPDRGIAADMRPKLWAIANDHGANLPREWLFEKAA